MRSVKYPRENATNERKGNYEKSLNF